MKGDGPSAEIFEDDPPVTLGEMVATSDNNFDLLGALAMARAWPEGVPARELEPWQRIGPDVLWMVCRKDYVRVDRIGREALNHVAGLRWVCKRKISRQQIERAVTDAIERLVERECMAAEIACLAVALRKETYLELRAEAYAFLVNCMTVAEYGVQIALGMREPYTPRKTS